jgi:hypothetical protein
VKANPVREFLKHLKDHLSRRDRFAIYQPDAGSSLAIEFYLFNFACLSDGQILTLTNLVGKIRDPGVHSHAVDNIQRRVRDTMSIWRVHTPSF